MKGRIGFVYAAEHLGRDGRVLSAERVHNLMPTEAVNYMLAAALTGGEAIDTWHLGLFGASRIPLASDTAESFLAEAGEITGYDGDARPLLALSPVSGGTTGTLGNPNVFDFAVETVVQGAFITSSPTFGDDTGLLLSAALFNAPKIIGAGESLRVPAGFFFSPV